MNLKDEFLAQFRCQPPEGTPAEIREKYVFLSCLSRKKTREVYLLQAVEDGSKAVLKAATLDDPEDLEREYRILQGLQYEGIPQGLGFTQTETHRYLLRSWLEGETLAVLVERDGVFPEARVLEITLALCEIVAYLHRQTPAIIFRDIKPQNIVLTQNGRVGLIDFGISKEEAPDSAQDTVAIGSVQFAAPENYGFTRSGPYTDIYALGRLMAWLATGSSDPKEYRPKIQSPALGRIIARCVQLSPERRYPSVEQLARRIRRTLHPPRLGELALALAAAALVLGGCLAVWRTVVAQQPDVDQAPSVVLATGEQYEKEAAFPVKIQVLNAGEPFDDCVVSIDNRHWFYPTQKGEATLFAYAYDQYTLKAATGNRTATREMSVNRNSSTTATIDMAAVPLAPELVELTCKQGMAMEFPLDIDKASELSLQGQPEGVAALQQGSTPGLAVDGSLAPGHYAFFLEARNEEGFACTMVSLQVEGQQPVVEVKTPEQLAAMQQDLAGHYRLAADIDLEGAPWQPIGNDTTPFTGVLDGGGHTISGLVLEGSQREAGLFGTASGAMIQNLVLAQPVLEVGHDEYGNVGPLAGALRGSLVRRCAVLGGRVQAAVGNQSNVGGLCGYADGLLLACFSSAVVEVTPPPSADSDTATNAGGLCGVLLGYIGDSGSAGEVKGSFVTGGLVGMNDNSVVLRSYSASRLDGPLVNGQFPPGGISHIIRVGRYNANCVFLQGTAEVGTSVTTNGYPYGLQIFTREEFCNPDRLAEAYGTANTISYASLDSAFPLPQGILQGPLAAPALLRDGDTVTLPEQEGVQYYYTLDGSDPRLSNETHPPGPVQLSAGQTLRVYASRQGWYDSEEITLDV